MSARHSPVSDNPAGTRSRLSLPQTRSIRQIETTRADPVPSLSLSARASSTERPHPSRVFRYLADTADRISRGPVLDWVGDTWMDDPRPVVVTSPIQPPRSLGRINLTRQYSGRPHVPGEDSGSENEDDVGMEGQEPTASNGTSTPPSVSQELDYADRLLNVPGAWPAEDQVAQSYATAGRTPTQDSIYDWAPFSDAGETTETTRTAPTNHVPTRRWRPSERLQDFASSTAARREASSTRDDMLTPIHPVTTRTTVTTSHDARQDLGRAMRDYRLARRAIRRRSVDSDTDEMLRAQNRDFIASVRSSTRRTPPVSRADPDNEHMVLHLQDQLSGAHSTVSDALNPVEQEPLLIERDQAQTENDREAHFRAGLRLNLSSATIRAQRQAMINLGGRAWASNTGDSLASGPLFSQGSAASAATADPDDTEREAGRNDTPLSSNIRFPGQRYRRLVETYKSLKRAEEGTESKSRTSAKAILRYLKQLRENNLNYVQAWQLAHRLNLKNIGATRDVSPALPMSVRDMPKPVQTSWLEAGMVWVGKQTADNPSPQNARMLLHQQPQRSRDDQSPRSREARERIEYSQRQNDSFRARIVSDRRSPTDQIPSMDALERTLLGSGGFNLLSWRESMRVLEDAERDLSTMLEWTNERIAQEDSRWASRLHLPETAPEQESASPSHNVQGSGRDHWRVRVEIHSVDWEKKTLTGTMSASQFPDRALLGYQPLRNQPSNELDASWSEHADTSVHENLTMDSYFTGEILDFEQFGFDSSLSFLPARLRRLLERPINTNDAVRQERMLDLDLHHWAGLGPFKTAVDCAIRQKQDDLIEKTGSTSACEPKVSHTSGTSTSVDSVITSSRNPDITMTEGEKDEIRDSRLLQLFADKDWLDKTFGTETGSWVLMRWKEKCFVSPGTGPNPDACRPYLRGNHETPEGRSRVWTTDSTSLQQRGAEAEARRHHFTGEQSAVVASGTWALTISGFYYVALHRQSGRIEALYCDDNGNDAQSWPRLEMMPEDEFHRSAESLDTAEFNASGDEGGGLRSCFPVIEMR